MFAFKLTNKVDVPEWLSGMTRNHVGSARAVPPPSQPQSNTAKPQNSSSNSIPTPSTTPLSSRFHHPLAFISLLPPFSASATASLSYAVAIFNRIHPSTFSFNKWNKSTGSLESSRIKGA
ncbi:hypothetical protein DVH24_039895 [Malus domestica]|uniref:Uncharacterized protein n=1 Tax=Malus domestica TaxID=3750 RepID=A0A498I6W3_MALDO|nr:hypothetical protein DVH24_039895 [Malus domestica]